VVNKNHGSPYDRGGADSYYQRGRNPHWYPEGTGNCPVIPSEDMTTEEIAEYLAGYEDNEHAGNFKDYL
jgi:hypothetical protein